MHDFVISKTYGQHGISVFSAGNGYEVWHAGALKQTFPDRSAAEQFADNVRKRLQAETYPDDNPKTVVGVTKPSLNGVPPIALLEMGTAFRDGIAKYGKFNWRSKRVTSSTYTDAAMRHLLAYLDGEECDPTTGVDHRAAVMACMAILLDADSLDMLNDDRGTHGKTAEYIVDNTKLPA